MAAGEDEVSFCSSKRLNLQARAPPRCVTGTKQISVKPAAGAFGLLVCPDAADARAAIAEMNCDRVVRMPGHDQHRRIDLTTAVAESNDIGVGNLELLSRRGADQGGVVPSQFRERLRQLLKPGVVAERAVPDAGVGAENDLKVSSDRCCWTGCVG